MGVGGGTGSGAGGSGGSGGGVVVVVVGSGESVDALLGLGRFPQATAAAASPAVPASLSNRRRVRNCEFAMPAVNASSTVVTLRK